MKITLAQINTTVGDLNANVCRCLEVMENAKPKGADLVVFPEMTITGYPPRDILYDISFVQATIAATQDLASRLKGYPPALIGSLAMGAKVSPHHPGLYNCAFLLQNGEMELVAVKQLLPIYDVFHEPRWFLAGTQNPPVMISGRKVGVLICEDLWDEEYSTHPGQALREVGAELLICLVASPYRKEILADRLVQGARTGCPLVFLNLVGATDELMFDGRSFVLNRDGDVVSMLRGFQEEIRTVDLDELSPIEIPILPSASETFSAIVMGIRDFANKNGLQRAYLGLSGGIDSAVTACLAKEAMGPDRVTGIAIPSRYSDYRSLESARELADSLKINLEVVPLEPLHRAFEKSLRGLVGGSSGENIQARLRMLVLMSYVNSKGGFLLNTSNKTELTLGYSTLYGDMAGALCPLGDVCKPEVYELANWINSQDQVIPEFTINRPPSAELKPDQTDPFDYSLVSPAIERLVKENQSNDLMRLAEHKRWQMGVVLKVSEKSFGSGRLIPITRH